MSAYKLIRKSYGRVLRVFGHVAGAVTFAMMLLVVSNAILRFLFNIPIGGTLELTESSLTILIFLSLALTQYEGGHIRVILVTRHLPPGSRQIAAFLAAALGAVFFVWASWAAWGFAMHSLSIHEQQWGSIRYPLYPVKFVIFGGLAALTLQFGIDMIGALLGDSPSDQAEMSDQEAAL